MFKYISEILSKFTQSQRVSALLILLFSIVIISIGPKIVESVTSSNEELELRVESQNTQIIQLNKRVNELNNQIIENQRECTNTIVDREMEIMSQISDLENRIKKETNKIKINTNRFNMVVREENSDPDRPRVAMSPAPIVEEEDSKTDQMMLDGLKKIKAHINKDIKTNKGN